MRRIFGILSMVAVALTFTLATPVPGSAADDGRVPVPQLMHGEGDHCVKPTDDMRRYHMIYLKHQRNATLYEGIRDTKFSFKKCIGCHAVPDPSGKNPHERSVEHFCFACHKYAAVWIDCFDCHASKLPENASAVDVGGETIGGAAK